MNWKDMRQHLQNCQEVTGEPQRSTRLMLADVIAVLLEVGDKAFGEEPAKSDFQVGDCVAPKQSSRLYLVKAVGEPDRKLLLVNVVGQHLILAEDAVELVARGKED